MTRKHNLRLEDKIAKLANIKENLDLPGADLYALQTQVNKLSKDAAKKYSNITNPSANIKSYLSDLKAVKLRIDVAVGTEEQRRLGKARSINRMFEDRTEGPRTARVIYRSPDSNVILEDVSDTSSVASHTFVPETQKRTSQDESEEASTTFLEACYHALCKFYESLLEWIGYLTPDYFKTAEQAPESTSELRRNSMFDDSDSVYEEGSWLTNKV